MSILWFAGERRQLFSGEHRHFVKLKVRVMAANVTGLIVHENGVANGLQHVIGAEIMVFDRETFRLVLALSDQTAEERCRQHYFRIQIFIIKDKWNISIQKFLTRCVNVNV